MKRGTFKQKTYAEKLAKLKEKQASARKSPKTPKKRLKSKTTANKSKSKGYQVPKWFKRIPYGSHGSTPTQKRYWKVISDTYRKDDWERYKGKCVSCSKILEDWKDGDLAHFKKYSVCNSWFKYERRNLALSCKGCNQREDGVVGHAFGEELKRRHHKNIIEWIEKTNECFRGQKMQEWEIAEKVAELRPDLVDSE